MQRFNVRFLVLFSLCFVGCEKETIEDNILRTPQFSSHFDIDNFNEMIPENIYQVDWNGYAYGYSDILEKEVYEFPVTLKYKHNNTRKSYTHTAFKILATVSADQIEFYAVKFLEKNEVPSQHLSILNLETFNGKFYIYDVKKNKIAAKRYIQGDYYGDVYEINKGYSNYATPNCQIETTRYYTDWYNVRNGRLEYSHTSYNGSSSERVCSGGGGGGGGGSGGNGGGPTNTNHGGTSQDEDDDCGDPVHGCFYRDLKMGILGDDQIINKLTGRAKCVYDKLKEKNGNLFKTTIGKFIDDPKYDLILTVGDCPRTDTACTDGDNVDTKGEITIIIENVNESPIEIAATILHESIHAELFRYVSKYKKTGITPNDKKQVFEYYKHYAELYGDVFKIDPKDVDGEIDHIYMTQFYVNPLAQALREIDGNKYPVDYYKGFAWDGLRKWDPNNTLGMDPSSENFGTYRNMVIKNSTICK